MAPTRVTGRGTPSDRIEELVVIANPDALGNGFCVLARADGTSLAFGHSLDRDDATWLRDMTLAALAPPRVYR